MDISKRVFGSNVDQEVQNHIKKLQGEILQQSPNEPVQGNIDYSYIGNRTPYVRMWTAVNVANAVRVEDSDGKKKWIADKGANSFFIVNDNRDDSYTNSELDPVSAGASSSQTYTTQGENLFLKPPAGIKGLNSKSEGSLGALRRTSIDFVVHNKKDFEEIYLPFFLKPGSTIFVDFGWSENNMSLYDPEKKYEELGQDIRLKEFFKQIVQKDQKTLDGGLSNTIAGQVTKYDVNIDAQGSFNCNIEIVSGNYRLLDKAVTEDNDLQFIFDNTIEELILTYLAAKNPKFKFDDLVGYREDSNLTEEDKKNLVIDVLDKITDTPDNPGVITTQAKRDGIFYQDSTKKGKPLSHDNVQTRGGKEAIYISFGFFEDNFLNEFISEWITYDDKGNRIARDLSSLDWSPSFSSRNSFVRYDSYLFDMQKTKYLANDNLISFLYPDTWNEGETYNSLIAKKTPDKLEDGGVWDEGPYEGDTYTSMDKDFRRIPLRELFISVPTISEAFRTSSNVNDALEFIFDRIHDDSGTIINVKMISTNDAQTSISFHDANMDMDAFNDEEILEFDLTSGNSLIQSFDLKFETPKAGLSSMIAIGNLETPEVFDVNELMKFNALNAVQGNFKKQIKHLPRFDDRPKRRSSLSLFSGQLYFSAKRAAANLDTVSDDNIELAYSAWKKNRKELERKRAEEAEGNAVEPEDNNQNLDTEDDEGNPIVYAKSDRDYYLLSAKIENFYNSKQNSISPVLPINLSLKSYGNNFLSYGDFFMVNYLPDYYKKRVVFQIVGVDHTLDTSGWTTNYTTVMRLKSQQKFRHSADIREDVPTPVIRYHGKLQQIKLDEVTLSLPPRAQNTGLKNIVQNVRPGYRTVIKPNDIEIQQVGNLEYPDMNIEESIFTINFETKAQKEKERKQDESRTISADEYYKTDEKFPMVANSNVSLGSSGATSYYGHISSLILGDELIDWEKVMQDYKNPIDDVDYTPYLQLFDPPYGGNDKGDRIDISTSNYLYVFPVEDPDEVGGYVSDQIYDTFSRYVDYFYKKVNISKENRTKILDNVFRDNLIAHQTRSNNLQYANTNTETTYNTNRNFHLFKSIFWHIPRNKPTEWSVFKIHGHNDYKVLEYISVPKKYLKTNYDKIFKDFYKKYISTKNNTSKFFTNEVKKTFDASNVSDF